MKHIIHDAEGFRLALSISGMSIEIISTWPKANHPEPHQLLSLTLPLESFERKAQAIKGEIQCAPH